MYEFWLSYNNNAEMLQLPVNPPELDVGNGTANERISVQNLGEALILQDPVLKTFNFSSFFPKHAGPYLGIPWDELKDPWEYIETIERWKNSGNPVRFIVTETPVNFAVSIELFDYNEKGGDVGTQYYDLNLLEYKFVKARQIQTKTDSAGNKTVSLSDKGKRPSIQEKPKTYTIKSGDNLFQIGKRYKVDWKEIARKNNIKAPYTIYPNQVLKL
ncbi:LysM peptidoglycan-binding domain-containing protein [Sporosarcina sp. Marseille-Q4943]|uniref:LysM peptidoglycan-binding domain-containing protein n=1 Tax=Sporosarcina sp. Marseille-Q4943 TaxID=2942204 RepID=UPI00208DCE76|nr:LysM peptidoglycan-binding domain-containing protein [Sporosarcina sp. Marseille-Q4943]